MGQRFDLLAIALLMLSAMLAVWFSLAGAPNLKEWQPLMAALIALGGGALAYKGAMAKVNFDRELQDTTQARRKLAILLRFRYALESFHNEITSARIWAEGTEKDSGIFVIALTLEDMKVQAPSEIEEAWSALEVLPREAMINLASLRDLIQIMNRAAATYAPDEKWEYLRDTQPPAEVKAFIEHCNRVRARSRHIARVLDSEIKIVRSKIGEY